MCYLRRPERLTSGQESRRGSRRGLKQGERLVNTVLKGQKEPPRGGRNWGLRGPKPLRPSDEILDRYSEISPRSAAWQAKHMNIDLGSFLLGVIVTMIFGLVSGDKFRKRRHFYKNFRDWTH